MFKRTPILLATALLLAACSQSSPKLSLNPPTGLTATPGAGTITLRWQDNSDNETGFVLYRQEVAESAELSAQQAAPAELEKLVSVPANTTQFDDASVKRGAVYRYGISAEGSGALSARAEAEASVALGNTAPVGKDMNVSAEEDTDVELSLLGSDVDGDGLSYRIVREPIYGSLSGEAPTLTYSPKADFNGIDSFTFVVNDGELDSAEATVTVRVGTSEDAPEANVQAVKVNEDGALPIVLSGTDRDSQGLAFEVTEEPEYGQLSGSAPNLVYTPNPNYNGPDSLSFTTSDGTSVSEVAEVSITVISVDDAPVIDLDTLDRNDEFAYRNANTTFTLEAKATDLESGDVSSDVTWTSDVDGDLGAGEGVELSLGEHNLTASVTVDGQTASESVSVSVAGWTYSGSAQVENQTQLNALKKVQTITGDLDFDADTALDFSPLDDLKSIGGYLYLYDIDESTGIEGFDSLESADGLYIEENDRLTGIKGFGELRSIGDSGFNIDYNPQLTTIEGFNKLASVAAAFNIYQNANLSSIKGFNSLTTVDTYLEIYENAALTRIEGFNRLETSGDLYLNDNDALTTLPTFAALTSVTDKLEISDHASLRDLSGFANLTSVDQFELDSNGALSTLSGFDSLVSVTTRLNINANAKLTAVTGFTNLTSAEVAYSQVANNSSFDCSAAALTFAPVDLSTENATNCTLK